MKPIRMHHCFNCGEELGPWDRFCEPLDHCGKRECAREAQDQMAMERADAHDRLDRDMGW